MPTYAYSCPKCGHEYDKIQKMSDVSLIPCPECGTQGDRKISGGAGVVFKGSGFYETDYKRPSDAARDKHKSKDGSKDKPKESKPETKVPTEKASDTKKGEKS